MFARRATLPFAQLRVAVRNYASDKGHGLSAAPEFPTGIEHQYAYNKRGKANPLNFEKDYKCIDYLKFNQWSFYDKENDIVKHRVPQPSNTRPDTEPKFKTSG